MHESPGSAVTNDDIRAIWDRKSAFWDAEMAEGNLFHRVLIAPATERLLQPQPGETVLDAACGNGQFARQLARLGARVVAFDGAPGMLEAARRRSADLLDRIDYHLIDATDTRQLLALGERRFDAVVCTMALMDIADIEPLFAASARLLKPGGRFVFSVLHPCFNGPYCALQAEEVEDDATGRYVVRYAVRVSRYLDTPPRRGSGMPGEPEPHWYFPRPLHELLGSAFRAGFVLDGLEEPAFPPGHTSARPISWVHFEHIPPVVVARLRLR